MTIVGGDDSMASGGSITISLGVGTATILESVAESTSNAGTAAVLGDLLMITGIARVGNSGTLGVGSGLSASGLGGSIAISVGSGTNIGGAFSVKAGNLLQAASSQRGCIHCFWIVIDQQWQELDSGLRRWQHSGGAVTIAGTNGSMASGCSITISSGVGKATSARSVAVTKSNAGTAGMLGDLLMNTGTARVVGNSGALGVWSGLSASGSGGSIAISAGSGTDIGGVFSVPAGNSSGAAR